MSNSMHWAFFKKCLFTVIRNLNFCVACCVVFRDSIRFCARGLTTEDWMIHDNVSSSNQQTYQTPLPIQHLTQQPAPKFEFLFTVNRHILWKGQSSEYRELNKISKKWELLKSYNSWITNIGNWTKIMLGFDNTSVCLYGILFEVWQFRIFKDIKSCCLSILVEFQWIQTIYHAHLRMLERQQYFGILGCLNINPELGDSQNQQLSIMPKVLATNVIFFGERHKAVFLLGIPGIQLKYLTWSWYSTQDYIYAWTRCSPLI